MLAFAAAGCETGEDSGEATPSDASPRVATDGPGASVPTTDGLTEPTPAPDFTLAGPGGSFTLADHRGEVVVLNFWATWNELSLDGMDALSTLHETLGDEGLAVVGIAADDDAPSVLRAWVGVHDAPPYPLVADLDGAVAEAYGGIELLPTTVVVDRRGRLRARHTGILSEDELLDLLAPVLIEDDEPLPDAPVAAPGAVRSLSADEADALARSGAVLVDLRDDRARRADGALPFALHRPAGRLAASDLPANFATPLIFVDEVGTGSFGAAEVAVEWGYVAVYHLDGGVSAWVAAGLPLDPLPTVPKEPSPREPASPVLPARTVLG